MKQEHTTIGRTSAVVSPLITEGTNRSPEKNKEHYLLVACIVLHSHLDYAWWRRRQSSQIREAKLIDGIMDALSADKIQSFTLEQAIAAKEYVRDLRRDRKEEFERLCQARRFE